MNTSRQVMSGPIHALVEGAPVHRRDGVDHPVTFDRLPEALDFVLATLARYNRASAALWSGDRPVEQSVIIVPVGEMELLLLGSRYEGHGMNRRKVRDTAVCRAVARLLPARGYRQRELPEPGTPLHTLGPMLPSRVLNCLFREGYTTVDQIAAVPDAALQDIRSMGVIGIRELRAAIATLDVPAPQAAPVVLAADWAAALAGLLGELAELAGAAGRPDLAAQAGAFQYELLPDRP